MSNRLQQSALSWREDGRDWPNHDASFFVEAAALRWHVQRMGRGSPIVLLHGTGAATHSWRDLMPLLARRFLVLAPDLPGHGFTDALPPSSLSLPGMARAVSALLKALEVEPTVAIGHSAGAAILARLCIDQLIAPKMLASVNGALLPFDGFASHILPAVAKLLYSNPLASRIFAFSADRAAAARLIRGTGSTIDRKGLDIYARLFGHPDHVAAALGMMANWDLDSLSRDLKRLATPLLLIAAKGDRAVPYAAAERLKTRVPEAHIETLRGVGHLAHEERPDVVASLIFRWAENLGVPLGDEDLP
jgi:magnesium chelatase accessory protein